MRFHLFLAPAGTEFVCVSPLGATLAAALLYLNVRAYYGGHYYAGIILLYAKEAYTSGSPRDCLLIVYRGTTGRG